MGSRPSFNELVAEAIAARGSIAKDEILILDNSDKYDPDGLQKNLDSSFDRESLAAIFDTMAKLNQEALDTPKLCSGSFGPSFRDALSAAAGAIAVLAKDRSVRFVELGPEPTKSKAILAQLLASGLQLHQYIGVDINPESESTMRAALEPLIGSERFTYWIQDFYKAGYDKFPPVTHHTNGVSRSDKIGVAAAPGKVVTVIINLGFQEGNDLPSRIIPMLAQLTRPGDIVLSEMQVSGQNQEDNIRQFYLHPQMRRFSALVAQKFDPRIQLDVFAEANGDVQSLRQGGQYIYQLVPMLTGIGTVNTATTLFSVQIDRDIKYILTNSCLKYTAPQFLQARESSGEFRVLSEQSTGDASVLFQIAERV